MESENIDKSRRSRPRRKWIGRIVELGGKRGITMDDMKRLAEEMDTKIKRRDNVSDALNRAKGFHEEEASINNI